MDKLYIIYVTGKFAEGVNRENAIATFSQKFGIKSDAAEKLFNGERKVIKKNADLKTAKQYNAMLKKIGIDCSVVEMADSDQPAQTNNTEVVPQQPVKKIPSNSDNTKNQIYQSAPNHPGYSFKIEGKPDYSFLTVNIPANETLKVEASAMATMDINISMKTKMKGGFSRLLTGESMFINDFSADGGPGEIGIAPGPPGDLAHYYLEGNKTIYLQNSAYVASASDVNVETKWQGLVKGFFSGESLFLIRCSGKGDLWFNTYGAMIEIDVSEDYVVDTGNIVAFTDGLEYKITSVGGYKSLFFSGEGLVCRFSGQGKVWIQTRKANAFMSWVNPFRPVEKK